MKFEGSMWDKSTEEEKKDNKRWNDPSTVPSRCPFPFPSSKGILPAHRTHATSVERRRQRESTWRVAHTSLSVSRKTSRNLPVSTFNEMENDCDIALCIHMQAPIWLSRSRLDSCIEFLHHRFDSPEHRFVTCTRKKGARSALESTL